MDTIEERIEERMARMENRIRELEEEVRALKDKDKSSPFTRIGPPEPDGL